MNKVFVGLHIRLKSLDMYRYFHPIFQPNYSPIGCELSLRADGADSTDSLKRSEVPPPVEVLQSTGGGTSILFRESVESARHCTQAIASCVALK